MCGEVHRSGGADVPTHSETQCHCTLAVSCSRRGRPTLFATSRIVGRQDKRTNNRTRLPALKNNAATGCKGPVKAAVVLTREWATHKINPEIVYCGNNFTEVV